MIDRELLQAYKDGDGDAFTDFFNRHVKDVTRLVRKSYSLPLSDIDNAVQMAFIGISRREEIPDDPAVFLQQAAYTNAKNFKIRKKNPSRRSKINFTSIDEVDWNESSTNGERNNHTQFIDQNAIPPGTENLRDTLDRAIQSSFSRSERSDLPASRG
jgi:DNA-directed RNA polymerase specialized sigma24 family protein